MKEKFDSLVQQLIKGNIFLPEAIELLEKSMIRLSLEETGGNQCVSSKKLGIHRNTLQRKMVAYGLANGRGRAQVKPILSEGRPRRSKRGVA